MIDYALINDLPKLTKSRAIVRFQDCDPLQHLNNIKYFDYFFNAREDQIAQVYQFNPTEVFKKLKAGWVIYHHEISYVRPANVGEWVRIFSRLAFYNENTIVVEYFMTDDSAKQLKTLLWSTMKYVDASSGKLTQHHPSIEKYLEATVDRSVEFENTTFFERVKQLRKELTQKDFLEHSV